MGANEIYSSSVSQKAGDLGNVAMDKLSLTNFVLFLAFVFPGFLSMKIYGLIQPTIVLSLKDSILEAVAFSMANIVIMFYFLNLIFDEKYIIVHPIRFYLFIILIFFIAPVVWPFVLQFILKICSKWGYILTLTPTAWDHFFAKREGCWIIFHLKDGRKIGGLFDSKSFASSYPKEGSIYVEEIWSLDDGGKFNNIIPGTKGMIFRSEDYDFIELFERNSP